MRTKTIFFNIITGIFVFTSCRLHFDEGETKTKENQSYKEEFKIEKNSSPEIKYPDKVFKAYEPLFYRTSFKLNPMAIKEWNHDLSFFTIKNNGFEYLKVDNVNLIYFPPIFYYNTEEKLDLEVEIELASKYHINKQRHYIYLEVENNYNIIYREPVAMEEIVGSFSGNHPTEFKKYTIKISDLPYAYNLMPKIYTEDNIENIKNELFIKNISYFIKTKKKVN
ncbi:hypothetical protein QEJ31_02600 [Pigmentibacter sp. JX0631]|uniref:hypothetical protein n=1 Tax=Pigmentibacter sp. JX0631 TaxID=2976982 RepID=UPI002468E54F|nr:hypothetical protein [Pigmentibacter sp. JX0631]WGL60491.1 hypothetical protein QEJ31_02600 [Pigmentibacter sp. JX0631]